MEQHSAAAEAAEAQNEDRLVPWQAGLRRLGISRATGYRLIAAGKLPTRRIGSKRLIRESDINRIIAEGTEG